MTRVKSETICRTLEEHGPRGLVAMPMPFPTIQRRELPYFRPDLHTEPAYKLAVLRIRELEEKLAVSYKWQEELLSAMEVMAPGTYPAEYQFAWQLLCETARKAYYSILYKVGDEIQERRHNEEMGYND